MNKLIYSIADEYLPDVTILGVDGPNTGLAGDIVDKVLDAVYEEIAPVQTYTFDGMKVKDEVLGKLNKLRSEK